MGRRRRSDEHRIYHLRIEQFASTHIRPHLTEQLAGGIAGRREGICYTTNVDATEKPECREVVFTHNAAEPDKPEAQRASVTGRNALAPPFTSQRIFRRRHACSLSHV